MGWTRLELSELVEFVKHVKGRKLSKEPVWWFRDTVQYIDRCVFEWDTEDTRHIGDLLDREGYWNPCHVRADREILELHWKARAA